MYVERAWPGGGSPDHSGESAATGTARFASTSSMARTARCFRLPRSMLSPPTRASTGPRIPYSNALPLLRHPTRRLSQGYKPGVLAVSKRHHGSWGRPRDERNPMLDHLVQKMALEGRIGALHTAPLPSHRSMGLRVVFGIVSSPPPPSGDRDGPERGPRHQLPVLPLAAPGPEREAAIPLLLVGRVLPARPRNAASSPTAGACPSDTGSEDDSPFGVGVTVSRRPRQVEILRFVIAPHTPGPGLGPAAPRRGPSTRCAPRGPPRGGSPTSTTRRASRCGSQRVRRVRRRRVPLVRDCP